jgi:putative transposase
MALFRQKKRKSQSLKKRQAQCLKAVSTLIKGHINVPTFGRTPSEIILEGVIAAAAGRHSVTSYTQSHDNLPSHATCLARLHNLDLDELERQSHRMLLAAAGSVIKIGKGYNFVIDITDDPYYGERTGTYAYNVVGGKQKASTNYFYAYISLYVAEKGRRITLATYSWTQQSDLLEAIQKFVGIINSIGLKIESLCIDREFYVAKIFRYLQEQNIPHIVPVKVQSCEIKKQLKGKSSKTFEYTLKPEKDDAVTVTVVDCVVYLKGKKKTHGLQHHAFVVYGLALVPQTVRKIYSHRFGIESSYRMRNQAKARTSTKDPVIRYFYTLIAFLIQNLWIKIQWLKFRKVQSGPVTIRAGVLTLDHFLQTIQNEALILFPLIPIDEL